MVPPNSPINFEENRSRPLKGDIGHTNFIYREILSKISNCLTILIIYSFVSGKRWLSLLALNLACQYSEITRMILTPSPPFSSPPPLHRRRPPPPSSSPPQPLKRRPSGQGLARRPWIPSRIGRVPPRKRRREKNGRLPRILPRLPPNKLSALSMKLIQTLEHLCKF